MNQDPPDLKKYMPVRFISLSPFCDGETARKHIGKVVIIHSTRYCRECNTVHYYIKDLDNIIIQGDYNPDNFIKVNQCPYYVKSRMGEWVLQS